jgi:hypothetical protein
VLHVADAELTEEEMILANAASEGKEAEQAIQKAALVLKMREGIGSLARILKTIEVSSRLFSSGYCLCITHVVTPVICPDWSNFRGKGTGATVAP